MKAWKIAAATAALSTLPLLALQACSGDDSGTNDGGPDATTDTQQGDVSQPDVAADSPSPGDAACPTYTGSIEFCKAAVARCGACGAGGGLNACQLQNFDALCTFYDGLFSAQFQAALGSCATVCDSDASSACQKAALADASLTTDQQKVATDYCARCGTGAGCAAQVEGQFNLVQLSDPLATQIDQNCTPDAGGPDSSACGFSYGSCVLGVEFAAAAGAPCADAGKD